MEVWRRFKIGVFGSAGGSEIGMLMPKASIIGDEIAKNNGILVTGACPGLPLAAALGAHSKGGIVLGISPAIDLKQHINKLSFPIKPYILIFTGMEKKGRNPISIRTCDAGIFISGRSGTLNEFTILFDEGDESKVVGLLEGSGGVVDIEIRSYINRTEKKSQTTVIIEKDPVLLVQKIFKTLDRLRS